MNERELKARTERGMIAWMARNRVTPNLMMIVCLVGGFFFGAQLRTEEGQVAA